MDEMGSRSARLARGWLVGVFATALAALSHGVAGGGTPSGLSLIVGVVFGGMLGTFALSSRPSLLRLTIAVGLSQLVFHVAFSTLGEAAATSGHRMDEAFVPMATHAHVDSPAMWLSHAAAGLVTLALLRGAEAAFWSLLVRLVIAPFRARIAVPVRRPRLVRASLRPARAASRLLSASVSRRGPPLHAF